ncbi:MAG: 50S ribosomal protein L10 [Candidatus Micrarchaeaceae archaeon]
MMLKAEKIEYVKKLQEELKKYKTVGIMSLDSVPDTLVQRVRNKMKPDVKFLVMRRSLALKALESDPRLAKLSEYTDRNFAILLSDKDPSELNKIVSSNKMKLIAKPNQISPEDISIESGDTSIAPGQAVTDLKAAGIDVAIQKGKVVISKSKVLVKKGEKISTAVSKALKMMDVMPFEAGTKLKAVVYENLLFNEKALGVDVAFVAAELAANFLQANALATEIGLVTKYNAGAFIRKGYLSAIGLGLEAEIYEPGITDMLIAKAVREALSLNGLVNTEPKSAQ